MKDTLPEDGLLLSHPDKLLSTHIAEVWEAARAILRLHSPDPERDLLVEEVVRLHDLGKATAAFQEYIRDTHAYRGPRNRKAHTPLGLAATLVLGECLGRDPFWKLCIPGAVLGHHSGFPNAHRLTAHHFGNDDWVEIIEKQAAEIPATEIAELTGFPLKEILADPDLCNAADDIAMGLIDDLKKRAKADVSGAVADRLRMQFVFSVLLEADKAFLALSARGRARYRVDREVSLPPEKVEEYLSDSQPSEINVLRTRARREALSVLLENPDRRLWTLTLPTGLGKTLAAASLAMSLREASSGPRRRIFIVLPFLSIVDQTAKVYSELLEQPRTSTMMQSHSLSERDYDDTEDERDAEFFLDTWDSEIVVTTFDQFLLSMLGERARHQMRFHNLADSILIFDEVQAMPTQLWDLVNHSLTQLTERLNSTAILMSATQPGFVEATESLIRDPKSYYDAFGRYQLVLKHRKPIALDEFVESVLDRREELQGELVLITLNTRASARAVRDALAEEWPTPVYFLTADVTPKDRLAGIEEIKNSKEPCLVVSTQVIEAGVDVDMTLVMRDFAPLDSLVQIAGRCNRNGFWPRRDVEVYHLKNTAARRSFAEMVYTVGRGSPDLRLEETRRVLESCETVPEEEVLGVCAEYFARLRDGKDLGFRHTRHWATLDEEQPDIRTLLRGERNQQVQLIVAERDEGDLKGAIEAALEVEDRWDRRRALRRLAGRIAKVTVSVWVRDKWRPEQVANPLGTYASSKPLEHPWWIVRPGHYDPRTGLSLEGDMFL